MIASQLRSYLSKDFILGLLIVLLLAIPTIEKLGPVVETHLFPVVGRLTITEIRPVADGTEISATAEKYRDCQWRKTVWYYGDRDGMNVPLNSAKHLDPPTVRPVGDLAWDRIFIPVRPEVVADRTFADAFHDCGSGRLTRSELYR